MKKQIRRIGTKYIKMSLSDIKNTFESQGNLWIYYAISTNKFDSIDMKNSLFGSRILDDILYVCVTDGEFININNKLVDPEIALFEYNIAELDSYITAATSEDIIKYISPYEMLPIDYTAGALWLLRRNFKFEQLVDDYNEFDGIF